MWSSSASGSRLQKLVWSCLVLLLSARHASSSEGDAADAFWSCMDSCQRTGCACHPPQPSCCAAACRPAGMPLFLRLTDWDCPADCSYHCMWSIEGPKSAAKSGPVYKYFGKWPFTRVLGAQEIASVLFSLANLAAHVHNLSGYLSSLRSMRSKDYPFKYLWLVYSLTNINAWWWSTVFHTRDTKVTEKFDYFSADLLVAVGVATCLTRVMALTKLPAIIVTWAASLFMYLQHIYYLAFVKFDYGYNMKVCIVAGVATALMWVIWALATKHPARKLIYWFIGLLHAAMLLEVLDFPPIAWIFDAHALWHAATVPLTYLWYWFILADVQAWLAGLAPGAPAAAKGSSVAASSLPGAGSSLTPGVARSPESGKCKNGD